MTRKRKVGISIAFIVVLALIVSVYTALYGTFWGRASAEKQIMNSVRQQYRQVKFHQMGYAHYDFESSKYEVNIVFDQLPNFFYSFAMENGKATLVAESGGYHGELPPTPVPYSTSWVNQGSSN